MPRFITTTLLIMCAAAVVGCNPPKAWQHKDLAHPTMTPAEITQGLDAHVRAVSEGAVGGVSGAGGGCGCN